MVAANSRYVVTETAVSAAINAAFSAAFVFLVFGGAESVALWGSPSLAADFLPQTFAVALMSVVVPTLITRRRVRAGKVPSSPATTRLPRNLILRAIGCAALATIICGSLATGALMALRVDVLPFAAVLALKIAYGAAVAVLVTPLAVHAALAD